MVVKLELINVAEGEVFQCVPWEGDSCQDGGRGTIGHEACKCAANGRRIREARPKNNANGWPSMVAEKLAKGKGSSTEGEQQLEPWSKSGTDGMMRAVDEGRNRARNATSPSPVNDRDEDSFAKVGHWSKTAGSSTAVDLAIVAQKEGAEIANPRTKMVSGAIVCKT